MYLLLSPLIFAEPLEFITFQASSQYYPQISVSEQASLLNKGNGTLSLPTVPDATSITINNNLTSKNIATTASVSLGNKASKNKGKLTSSSGAGTAANLETVNADVKDIYVYTQQFPMPKSTISWQNLKLSVKEGTGNSGTNSSLLSGKFLKTGEPATCPFSVADDGTCCNEDEIAIATSIHSLEGNKKSCFPKTTKITWTIGEITVGSTVTIVIYFDSPYKIIEDLYLTYKISQKKLTADFAFSNTLESHNYTASISAYSTPVNLYTIVQKDGKDYFRYTYKIFFTRYNPVEFRVEYISMSSLQNLGIKYEVDPPPVSAESRYKAYHAACECHTSDNPPKCAICTKLSSPPSSQEWTIAESFNGRWKYYNYDE